VLLFAPQDDSVTNCEQAYVLQPLQPAKQDHLSHCGDSYLGRGGVDFCGFTGVNSVS
jgi:hypothetical protein